MKVTRMTPLEDLPNLLRVPEAAAWAGVGAGIIYDMARTGQLDSVKLGRLVRIPRSALAAWAGSERGDVSRQSAR